jgi:hypothetical protein
MQAGMRTLLMREGQTGWLLSAHFAAVWSFRTDFGCLNDASPLLLAPIRRAPS